MRINSPSLRGLRTQRCHCEAAAGGRSNPIEIAQPVASHTKCGEAIPSVAPRNDRRGSILILVLWSLFFLAMLAVAVSGYIGPRLDLGGKLLGRARMHYLAKAGVKRAIFELEKDKIETNELYPYESLEDAWAVPLEGSLDDGEFKVELVDEERKININKVSESVLRNFFEIAGGATSQEAEDIAASVMDWRDEDDDSRDNGAEDGYYSMRRPGYPCKNADFEIPEELLLVKGVTKEIFDAVQGRITVYTEGAVNINTADEVVLQSLGMDKELVEKIIRFRQEGDEEGSKVFQDVEEIAALLSGTEELSAGEIAQLTQVFAAGLFSVLSDNFKGRSSGKITNAPHSVKIDFVFDRVKRRMLYWRET